MPEFGLYRVRCMAHDGLTEGFMDTTTVCGSGNILNTE
jgi:hypothetical protein